MSKHIQKTIAALLAVLLMLSFASAMIAANAASNVTLKKVSGTWYTYQDEKKVTYTGLVKNDYGWWYCKNGTIDFSFTGLAGNQNGIYLCKKGKVNFNANGLWFDTYNGTKAEWNVTKGKVVKGKATVKQIDGKWWLYIDGRKSAHYTGLVRCTIKVNGANSNADWYVKNGQIQTRYTGTIDTVLKGKAARVKIVNGKVPYNTTFSVNVNYNGKHAAVIDGVYAVWKFTGGTAQSAVLN